MDQRPLVICIPPPPLLLLFTPCLAEEQRTHSFFWKRWLLLCESLLRALAQSETQHPAGGGGGAVGFCMWDEEWGHWWNMYRKKGVAIEPVDIQVIFWHRADVTPPPPPWPHGSIDITRHKRKSTLSHTAAWISDVTQNYLVPYRNDNVLTKVKFEVQWNFIECVRFLETCILIQQTLRRSSQSSGLLLCSHFSHKESTDGDVFIPSEQQENTIWKRVTSLISESDSE